MINVKCNICGARSTGFFSKNKYQFYKCSSCGFIFVDPPPEKTEVVHHYSEHYYSEFADRYQRMDRSTYQNWKKRIGIIEKYLSIDNRPERTIIDVGCATGNFLQVAAQCNWSVFGIEHSIYAARQASERIGKERIYTDDFLEFQKPLRSVALSAWDVIEHVSDPISFLLKANSLLHENGILALSTVNTDSLNHQLFGANWRYYRPPEHLSHFNLDNLRMALNKTGFDVLHYRTQFTYLSFLDGMNPNCRPQPNNIDKSVLLIPRFLARLTNRGDVIEIWARKSV
jgi:predicted TPR repeat methyltransferase